jgi:hypothetical protein
MHRFRIQGFRRTILFIGLILLISFLAGAVSRIIELMS